MHLVHLVKSQQMKQVYIGIDKQFLPENKGNEMFSNFLKNFLLYSNFISMFSPLVEERGGITALEYQIKIFPDNIEF